MKNKITLGLFTLVMAAIISSCSTSSDVASNRKIQKRKYNKGFFVSNNNIAFNKKKDNENTVVVQSEDVEVASNQAEVVKKEVKTDAAAIVTNTNVVSPSIEPFTEVVINESSIAIGSSIIEKSNDIKTIEIENNVEVQSVESNSKQNSNSSNSGVMLVVLVILALILPPLAVLIFEGVTTRFWIDLLLAILAIGGFVLIGGLAGLAGLLAVIYALLIVLEVI